MMLLHFEDGVSRGDRCCRLGGRGGGLLSVLMFVNMVGMEMVWKN